MLPLLSLTNGDFSISHKCGLPGGKIAHSVEGADHVVYRPLQSAITLPRRDSDGKAFDQRTAALHAESAVVCSLMACTAAITRCQNLATCAAHRVQRDFLQTWKSNR